MQVLVRYWLKQDHSVTGYRFLGAITLLQAFISLLIYIRKQFLSTKENTKTLYSRSKSTIGKPSTSSEICILCMDNRKDVSAIPCGHIFCWECILEWLTTKNECPICREPSKPSNVVYLFNYQGV